MADLASPGPPGGRRSGTPPLSDREWQVLRLLAEGRSTAQIADELSISSNTARTRIRGLRAKLDAATRPQVVPRAWELGLLPGGPSAARPPHADEPSSAIGWRSR
jgi:ATP/maltotriose-dependent transcriptional regulator MalT